MIIDRIEIEGIDKTGKDTLAKYIDYLSGRKYVINVRGILSQIAYSKIYNRNYDYDKNIEGNKGTIIILLHANMDDLNVRYKITNEPDIDKSRDMKVFDDTATYLRQQGIEVWEYNTSCKTPYMIAKEILSCIDAINDNMEN